MKHETTETTVSGAICGNLWMPDVKAGYPHRFDLRRRFDRFSDGDRATFRDALLLELMEKGGDFQDAKFTVDTRVTVVRRASIGPGKYSIHVWERDLYQLPNCDDLIDFNCYTYDVIGE